MSETPPTDAADVSVSFDRKTDLDGGSPTLIEGLPGMGLVAAIAVDQINQQLGLAHHGNIVSEEFPQVLSFEDGRARDLVRVYAGQDPPLMTLQSDVALPGQSFDALSQCVLEDLAEEFDRAIFLAGRPAENEDQVGEVTGVATDDSMETALREADVSVAEGSGLVGGVTGALANRCYQADVPAAVLVVRAHPYLPDPAAARSVIENALEPMVEFDIDTSELAEQADDIRQRMEQIAEHYRQAAQGDQQQQQPSTPGMYQ